MRHTLTFPTLALALTGCSLISQPDYDAIPPYPDAGLDSGMVDAGDASPDAGDAGDGGMACVPSIDEESVDVDPDACRDGEDDDCDGLIDCQDPDCGESLDCCSLAGAWSAGSSFESGAWDELPSSSPTPLTVEANAITEFGAQPGALMYTVECAPLAFGLDLAARFAVQPGCTGCNDFAAFALTPTDAMVEGDRLTSEVAVVIGGDGSARVERAGIPVEPDSDAGEQPVPPNTLPRDGSPVRVEMDLRPGADAATGGAVLRVTVRLSWEGGAETRTLVRQRPLVLLEDLRSGTFCSGSIDGLRVAIEGRGDLVHAVLADPSGPTTIGGTQRRCANPSYFERLALDPGTTLDACNEAQLGEPSLVSYDTTSGAWWELWVDGTPTERENELGDYPDFQVCGARTDALTGSWLVRDGSDGAPLLPRASMPASAREPYVWAPQSLEASPFLHVVWAQRTGDDTSEHELYIGQVQAVREENELGVIEPLLSPDHPALGACDSLRDPALVARGPDPKAHGLWLLFTCEGAGTAANRIGAAALAWNEDDQEYELDLEVPVRTDFLTNAIGDYAQRGPFSPEPTVTFDEGFFQMRLQLWFLVRSGAGDLAVAYASGQITYDDELGASELPEMDPYPANPILRPDDGVFQMDGGCPSGCRFNGLGVTRSVATPDYHLVIGRTVAGPGGETHQLVPLRQRRPNL